MCDRYFGPSRDLKGTQERVAYKVVTARYTGVNGAFFKVRRPKQWCTADPAPMYHTAPTPPRYRLGFHGWCVFRTQEAASRYILTGQRVIRVKIRGRAKTAQVGVVRYELGKRRTLTCWLAEEIWFDE